MTPDDPTAKSFEDLRPRLLSLAYRMIGSMTDAEDAVQDAYLRWRRADAPSLEHPLAWFTRTVTRICLDRVDQVQRRREDYSGEWLPDPFPDREGESRSEIDDSLSFAILRLVERLSAAERATWLLHDVFGHDFAEVAEILDRSPAACRQLAVRARRHLQDTDRRAPITDPQAVSRLSAAFFAAAKSGELDQLHAVLAEDVVLLSDGGGKVAAVPRPLEGRDAVSTFFHRIYRKQRAQLAMTPTWFNGGPGFIITMGPGEARSAFHIEIASVPGQEPRIQGIYVQRNPDKLAHLDDPPAMP